MKGNIQKILFLGLGITIAVLVAQNLRLSKTVALLSKSEAQAVSPTSTPVTGIIVRKVEYLDISYPQITGIEDEKTQKGLNDEIFKFVNKIMTSEKTESGEVHIDYEIHNQDTDLISIVFYTETNDFFQVHPNYDAFTFNYSLKDKSEIKLEDFLSKHSLSLEEVAKRTAMDLKKKLPQFNEGNTAPKLVNYSKFIITQKEIKFIFPPYQVASYSEGFQETTIEL